MDATTVQGFYTHRTRNYDGTYNDFTVLVEVIGEKGRFSYRVRLLQPLVGYQIGKLMTVRRHNVRLRRPEPVRHDCSSEWWNY